MLDDTLMDAFDAPGRAPGRRAALLAHLNEHLDFYRYALFQALPPAEQRERLLNSSVGALQAGPKVLIAHDDLLAVALSSRLTPAIAALRGLEDIDDSILLPTPQMHIESQPG